MRSPFGPSEKRKSPGVREMEGTPSRNMRATLPPPVAGLGETGERFSRPENAFISTSASLPGIINPDDRAGADRQKRNNIKFS